MSSILKDESLCKKDPADIEMKENIEDSKQEEKVEEIKYEFKPIKKLNPE